LQQSNVRALMNDFGTDVFDGIDEGFHHEVGTTIRVHQWTPIHTEFFEKLAEMCSLFSKD